MRDKLIPKPNQPPAWRDRLLANFRRKQWRGFVRLYGLLKPVAANRQIRTVTRYGSQFFLTPWDSVDSYVIGEGFYESEVLEAVRPALGRDAILWVVGANFGLHAITAKRLHPETTVVAFEPSPAMGARLLENCELNEVSVDLHAYALSASNGALPFFANASGNPGMSTLYPVKGFSYDHRFLVATLTARQVIEQKLAHPPTVMILDAEGAETEVLKGFGPFLASEHLRVLVFEAPNEFLETPPDKLHTLVTSAGFSLQKLHRNEKTGHSLSNYLATRK
jgi:FkbM family methyltransferase